LTTYERHIESHHGLGEPFQGEFTEFFERCRLLDCDRDPLGDKVLPVLGFGTEPGGEVAYRADRGVAGTVRKADLTQGRVALRDGSRNQVHSRCKRQAAINVPAASRIAIAILTARRKRTAIRSECGCYSMTSSARARIDGGTVRSSPLAVVRLTTSWKVVGCCTGRSAGLSPFKILPT